MIKELISKTFGSITEKVKCKRRDKKKEQTKEIKSILKRTVKPIPDTLRAGAYSLLVTDKRYVKEELINIMNIHGRDRMVYKLKATFFMSLLISTAVFAWTFQYIGGISFLICSLIITIPTVICSLTSLYRLTFCSEDFPEVLTEIFWESINRTTVYYKTQDDSGKVWVVKRETYEIGNGGTQVYWTYLVHRLPGFNKWIKTYQNVRIVDPTEIGVPESKIVKLELEDFRYKFPNVKLTDKSQAKVIALADYR